MKYKECREWLENRRLMMGSVPGLDAVKLLMEKTGTVSCEANVIHIAGTNGKGSIGYLLESVLSKSKIKTGRFLSPAVFDEREIILVNGKLVSKRIWEEKLTFIIDIIEKYDLKATAFEIEFVLSLLIFKETGCQVVILECGMGGLLDATNALDCSLVDIISSLSVDHCNFLGDTLKEISLHKFGIIKPSSKNVVLAKQAEEVYEYFDSYIKEKKLLVNITKSDINECKYKLSIVKNNPITNMSYKSYDDLILSLPGINQVDNAICILDAIDVLKKEGIKIKDKAVYDAFLEASWPGRFEIIDSKRLFILDGAHNPDAIKRLFENISIYFTKRKLIYIMGMYKDKDYEKSVEISAPKAKCIVCVSPRDSKRALSSFELGDTVRNYNPNVTAADSYEEALEMAELLADKNDVILIFGSLSFLGDFKRLIKTNERK